MQWVARSTGATENIEHSPTDDLTQEAPLIQPCVNAIADLLRVPSVSPIVAYQNTPLAAIPIDEFSPTDNIATAIPVAISITISTSLNPSPTRAPFLSRENLSRLMALAGESMTELTWLDPFARSLLQVKSQQFTLIDLLDQLQAQIPKKLDPKLQALLTAARTTANHSRRAMSDCTTDLDDFSRRSTQLADRFFLDRRGARSKG